MARCPECGVKLRLDRDLERWSRIYCESCDAELEVLSLRPLELEAVYDFEENDVLSDVDDDDLDDLDELEWDDDEEDLEGPDDDDDDLDNRSDW